VCRIYSEGILRSLKKYLPAGIFDAPCLTSPVLIDVYYYIRRCLTSWCSGCGEAPRARTFLRFHITKACGVIPKNC
jgi:hypothetical protein